jgi:hypothetical protein
MLNIDKAIWHMACSYIFCAFLVLEIVWATVAHLHIWKQMGCRSPHWGSWFGTPLGAGSQLGAHTPEDSWWGTAMGTASSCLYEESACSHNMICQALVAIKIHYLCMRAWAHLCVKARNIHDWIASSRMFRQGYLISIQDTLHSVPRGQKYSCNERPQQNGPLSSAMSIRVWQL